MVSRYEWRDLADSELRAKLHQRGVRSDLVDALVVHRDLAEHAEVIDGVFNP